MVMYDYYNYTSEKIKNVKYNEVLFRICFTYSDEDFIVTSNSFNCPFMMLFLYELSGDQEEKLRKYIMKMQ